MDDRQGHRALPGAVAELGEERDMRGDLPRAALAEDELELVAGVDQRVERLELDSVAQLHLCDATPPKMVVMVTTTNGRPGNSRSSTAEGRTWNPHPSRPRNEPIPTPRTLLALAASAAVVALSAAPASAA